LLTRARAQVNAAIDASYVNNWSELDDVARGLEQTAKFLPKATELPAKQKDTIVVIAGDLGKEAAELREAAKAKDVDKTDDTLKRLHQTVRKLRID
jgi:predicted translin family RNA/ssDNA-binding protein